MAKTANKRRPRIDAQTNLRLIANDQRAMVEGPSRKHWSTHDLKHIRPITENQKNMFRQYMQGDQLLVIGCAGTGKTFLSMYLAVGDVLNPDRPQDQIIIIRSAVATREQGFLPGTIEDKQMVYELPYKDVMASLFGRDKTYDDMKDAKLIKFMTTSHIRGLTWDNAIVIVDECQNMTFHELNSIMTRIGSNTRVIFAGDVAQSDLSKSSRDITGLPRYSRIIARMSQFSTVEFTHADIVRSDLVKSWIIASEQVPE